MTSDSGIEASVPPSRPVPPPPRAALWILVGLVGASALAFGAVEGWAAAWLLVGCVAAFLAASWDVGPLGLLRGASGAVALPAMLLVGWGIVQCLPLPRAAVARLSPEASKVQAELVPPGGGVELPARLVERARREGIAVPDGAAIPEGIADSGSASARSSLSILPHATGQAVFAWIGPILIFLASRRVAADRVLRYRLLWGVAGCTGVLGAVAILQRFASNGRLMWIRESPSYATPVGPFVNPNHFAGWTEMGLLVTLGLGLAIVGGPTRRLSPGHLRAALLDREWALPRLLVIGGVSILAAGGMILSGSRGGFMALAAGLVFLLPIGRLRSLLPAAAALAVLAGLGVGLASWLGLEDRTLQTGFFAAGATDPSLSMRSDIWGRTFRIVADYPVTGSGLGTFRHAYAAYDREGEWLSTDQAHNDYLQLVAETGIVGAALLLAWVVVLVRRVLVRALRAADGPPPWTTVAMAAAIFAMLVHTVLEFNLQIPAVATLFAAIGGALTAAAEDAPARARQGAS